MLLRKHPRITLIGKVDIRGKGSTTPPGDGYAINISKGGVAMYADRAFDINSKLLLTVYFRYEFAEEMEDVTGVVRWVKPVNDLYAFGIEFEEIREESNPMILAYIDTSMELTRPRSSEG